MDNTSNQYRRLYSSCVFTSTSRFILSLNELDCRHMKMHRSKIGAILDETMRRNYGTAVVRVARNTKIRCLVGK